MSALNSVLENDAGVSVVEIDSKRILVTGEKTITWLSGVIVVEEVDNVTTLESDGDDIFTASNRAITLYGRGRVQIAAT